MKIRLVRVLIVILLNIVFAGPLFVIGFPLAVAVTSAWLATILVVTSLFDVRTKPIWQRAVRKIGSGKSAVLGLLVAIASMVVAVSSPNTVGQLIFGLGTALSAGLIVQWTIVMFE